ncbi:uncharacterized protein LOC110265893 isoform X1 [Arachis ipaensis]|uniref:uncharacterized protein LOC110265893 isoform X1 n=1 Tax=Arachis ipaensis TaxID=130454 RepID=UPI000A2B6ADE|nr:uncharacterized protein LOC110265893 isoform X1 [Arachis ipaensis]
MSLSLSNSLFFNHTRRRLVVVRVSLPSLGSSSPAQKQRNQQLALAVFFLRRLPWARPRSSSFGFGASPSLPSCRSRSRVSVDPGGWQQKTTENIMDNDLGLKRSEQIRLI